MSDLVRNTEDWFSRLGGSYLSHLSTASYSFYSLGGGDTNDEMQKLEEKARQLAEESMKDQAKPDKGILFVR